MSVFISLCLVFRDHGETCWVASQKQQFVPLSPQHRAGLAAASARSASSARPSPAAPAAPQPSPAHTARVAFPGSRHPLSVKLSCSLSKWRGGGGHLFLCWKAMVLAAKELYTVYVGLGVGVGSGGQGWSVMLVFFCCIRSYRKLSGFRQYPFISSQFSCQSPSLVWLGFLLRISWG